MDAAGPCQHSIGRDARKPFINQVLVGGATTEGAWVGPASIAILRLDEHQRHGGLCGVWTRQIELASIVESTPRIADALHL
jgi:hypothetical protein